MASKLESEIDRLYQLPVEEFTAARNALAKTAGGDAARVKSLAKPPVAAWAVNQLYWHDRPAWDELIAAAAEARRANKAVLAGKSGDIRAAGKVHEDAVETALKRTLALLTKSGHPATDQTRQAIVTTLRALPADEPPGRLTRVLQPGGFEMLSGLSIAPGGKLARMPKPAHPAATRAPAHRSALRKGGRTEAPAKPRVDPKLLTRARQAVAAAERELREAETASRRAEFEKAKAEREADRARKDAAAAEEALSRATERVESTDEAVEHAREQLQSARAGLEQVEKSS